MAEVDEAELLDAGQAGTVLDCADGGRRRRVEASLLRRCCRELKNRIDPRGIRLQNGEVTGCLDLAALDVPFPLRFEGCAFESAPVVEGAQLHELAFTGCERLPGLLGNGLRVHRDLDLSRSTVAGGHQTSASTSAGAAIWLCEAQIGGRLLCVGTVIRADGRRSLQADRMHVAGTVRLMHGFSAMGQIRMHGVQIGGSLDLTGARIENPAGAALDLDNAIIGGDLFIASDKAGRRPVILGRLDMGSARISGQFLIRDAVLREPGSTTPPSSYHRFRPGGTTVRAPRLSVGVEVTFAGSTEVTGGLDLSMSDMSSLAVGPECTLRAPGRTVLDLTNANLRSSLTLSSQAIEGTVRLTGALVHGDLSFQGARLNAPESGSLLAAQGVSVDGDVLLRDLHATGGRLRFSRAVLGSVVAAGAQLANPGGQTLGLHQATVGGSVILTAGFSSDGLVMLSRSTVEGELECAGGSFTCPAPSQRNPQGNAIEAISATIRGGMDLSWAAISPSVDFTNATTTFLADNPETWPPRFVISGFSYDRFEQSRDSRPDLSWDQSARCAWLSRQAVHDRGSYEHAARVFRQHGYTGEAEAILIAQRKQARRTTSGGRRFPRRVLDAIYGTTVGYGYRPGRVLWFLATLLVLVIGSLEIPAAQATMRAATQAGSVYSTRGLLQGANTADPSLRRGGAGTTATTDVCGNGQVRCFSPVIYGIDTVIPLVSLDQRSTWYPDPHAPHGLLMQWWLNAATLLGWLLSSIFVLSLARLARTV